MEERSRTDRRVRWRKAQLLQFRINLINNLLFSVSSDDSHKNVTQMWSQGALVTELLPCFKRQPNLISATNLYSPWTLFLTFLPDSGWSQCHQVLELSSHSCDLMLLSGCVVTPLCTWLWKWNAVAVFPPHLCFTYSLITPSRPQSGHHIHTSSAFCVQAD